MYISEVLAMPNGIEKAKELAIRGLINREIHHKQWYIEQVLLALDVNLEELYQDLIKDGDINENEEDVRGIAP